MFLFIILVLFTTFVTYGLHVPISYGFTDVLSYGSVLPNALISFFYFNMLEMYYYLIVPSVLIYLQIGTDSINRETYYGRARSGELVHVPGPITSIVYGDKEKAKEIIKQYSFFVICLMGLLDTTLTLSYKVYNEYIISYSTYLYFYFGIIIISLILSNIYLTNNLFVFFKKFLLKPIWVLILLSYIRLVIWQVLWI